MRIENLRYIEKNNTRRATATIIYEDIDCAPADVYFHTSQDYSHLLGLNPDAFLVAAYLSAMYMGEKRIWIEGELDENLKKGLIRNMQTFQRWYGRKYKVVRVESGNKDFSESKNSNSNTGLFFSGGLDSIYSLRTNRIKYDSDHPLFIKDCFIVHGFDIHQSSQSNEDMPIFKRAIDSAQKVTDEAQTNLIPVFTNLRHHLYGGELFWPLWQHGSALAAVGHCFTSRISSVFIASSHASSNIEPWGSHPLIDSNCSSTDLKVIHDDLCSIFEKVQLVSKWEIGFQNIRTCYQNDEALLNCCHCEKCTKIMIMLMALGILEESQAFTNHHIPFTQLEDVLSIQTEADFKVNYLQLVPFLQKHGYQDMANLILRENRLRPKLRRLDQRYFQGKLKRFINSLC